MRQSHSLLSRIVLVSLGLLCLSASLPSSTSRFVVEAAPLKRSATRGQRKKGWRRRAEDWASAQDRKHTHTIITNPSTLGKGKGKGAGGDGEYVDNADDNGRTTFLIKCAEARAAKQAAVDKTGTKAGGYLPGGKGALKGPTGYDIGPAEEAMAKEGVVGKDAVKAERDFSTKMGPDEVCDEYDEDQLGTDGGYGDGVVGGDGIGEGEYPTEDTWNQGLDGLGVQNSLGGLASCEAIAAGDGPASGSSMTVEVELDVIKQADLPTEGITQLMQADLQYNVAPAIADCIGEGSNGLDDGSNDGTTLTGGTQSTDTLITDAQFQAIGVNAAGCSSTYASKAEGAGGECIRTVIPVVLYHDGTDTSGFQTEVENAINNHQWNVPGLVETFPVQDSAGVTAIEQQQVTEDDRIGPAGYLTLAAAALVLVLLAVMLARRKQRDEIVKHVELGDDDDETYLRDMEADSNQSSPNRLARVVGDDDSMGTGWTGGSRLDGTADGWFANTESRPSHQDVHVCSSATCEVCERNRQSGVQFIPSGATLTHPPLPPDNPREYGAEDTVQL